MARILRTHEVEEITGLSKSTLWRLEHAKEFPSRVRLSRNAVGWLAEDVEDWLNSRHRGFAAKSSTKTPTRTADAR